MRKLQRGNAPDCLANFQHGLHNWEDVTPNDKAAIWIELDAMQKQRCAYCEAGLSNDARHIEHFHQKGRDPKKTFVWSNLFGSCNRQDSCGKHKDKCGSYNPGDLIKPDEEDPEYFFQFISDGTIAIRNGLSPEEQHRAKETLRIFNLDAQRGPLRYMRQQAVAGYIQLSEELLSLANEYSMNECLPLLQSELDAAAHLPFFTAIKHTLLPEKTLDKI